MKRLCRFVVWIWELRQMSWPRQDRIRWNVGWSETISLSWRYSGRNLIPYHHPDWLLDPKDPESGV